MRPPFLAKASVPRIRAIAPGAPRVAPPPSAGVFREFVATLERLEKSRRRKPRTPPRPR
ncbi:hypothetical protein GCM10007301_10710 [Azorhizobium oxalatiphilum]|uniref:Uncharacterized protein n=1 Tax=Azorhizobium oxalatiphilum TaxID=980631 RepID=A0A917BQE5_9HYPH|nr:hypothetical protein [Azorhizobium oxalatiphilum]GGF53104.1 hypothetical protein GCM10007301_10710 [Azorhizobium oxalatiphilum]